MKKLIFFLSLVLLFSSGCIASSELGGPKQIDEKTKKINEAVELALEKDVDELAQKKAEIKLEVEGKYCEKDSDCIKVGTSCNVASFNKNATEAIEAHKKYSEENCFGSAKPKKYSDPYCKNNFCTITIEKY